MQVCKEFPVKRNTECSEEQPRIVDKTGVHILMRSLPPYKEDADENTDDGGFQEFAAGVSQSLPVLLLPLLFPVFGLLLPVLLNLGGTGIAQAGRLPRTVHPHHGFPCSLSLYQNYPHVWPLILPATQSSLGRRLQTYSFSLFTGSLFAVSG